MALQYTENGIHFNNLKPTTRGDGAIPAYDQYYMADTNEPADKRSNGYIARPEYTYINAIDIDWGEAQLKSASSLVNDNVETVSISKTSDLLNYLQNKINESDFLDLLFKYLETDSSLQLTQNNSKLIITKT